jgi:hypothetical protein
MVVAGNTNALRGAIGGRAEAACFGVADRSISPYPRQGPPPAALDPALLTQAKLAVAKLRLNWDPARRRRGKRLHVPSPIYTHHDSAAAPAWAAGRACAKTAGPFVDHRGFEFWVDSYEPVSYLQVFRAHGGPPFLMIPAESDAPGAQRSELIAGLSGFKPRNSLLPLRVVMSDSASWVALWSSMDRSRTLRSASP